MSTTEDKIFRGYNPNHPEHIDCIVQSDIYNDGYLTLIVVPSTFAQINHHKAFSRLYPDVTVVNLDNVTPEIIEEVDVILAVAPDIPIIPDWLYAELDTICFATPYYAQTPYYKCLKELITSIYSDLTVYEYGPPVEDVAILSGTTFSITDGFCDAVIREITSAETPLTTHYVLTYSELDRATIKQKLQEWSVRYETKYEIREPDHTKVYDYVERDRSPHVVYLMSPKTLSEFITERNGIFLIDGSVELKICEPDGSYYARLVPMTTPGISMLTDVTQTVFVRNMEAKPIHSASDTLSIYRKLLYQFKYLYIAREFSKYTLLAAQVKAVIDRLYEDYRSETDALVNYGFIAKDDLYSTLAPTKLGTFAINAPGSMIGALFLSKYREQHPTIDMLAAIVIVMFTARVRFRTHRRGVTESYTILQDAMTYIDVYRTIGSLNTRRKTDPAANDTMVQTLDKYGVSERGYIRITRMVHAMWNAMGRTPPEFEGQCATYGEEVLKAIFLNLAQTFTPPTDESEGIYKHERIKLYTPELTAQQVKCHPYPEGDWVPLIRHMEGLITEEHKTLIGVARSIEPHGMTNSVMSYDIVDKVYPLTAMESPISVHEDTTSVVEKPEFPNRKKRVIR